MIIRTACIETDLPGIIRVINPCNATTGMIRDYRGRKIALALKVLVARYARLHGARKVQTDNDSLNAPILAINRRMGYQPLPGTYQLVCWLEET